MELVQIYRYLTIFNKIPIFLKNLLAFFGFLSQIFPPGSRWENESGSGFTSLLVSVNQIRNLPKAY